MYTQVALLDIHERTQRNVAALIDHCRCFSEDDFVRKHEGFGYPSIQLQLHHSIGAQKYWIGVLEGRMDVDDSEGDCPDTESVERFRQEVSSLTEQHLRSTTDEALNTPQRVVMWGGNEADLCPAHVFLRTAVHYYSHQGQVAAMCRQLGSPVPPGLDFPLR